jgi:hypothetical protein
LPFGSLDELPACIAYEPLCTVPDCTFALTDPHCVQIVVPPLSKPGSASAPDASIGARCVAAAFPCDTPFATGDDVPPPPQPATKKRGDERRREASVKHLKKPRLLRERVPALRGGSAVHAYIADTMALVNPG